MRLIPLGLSAALLLLGACAVDAPAPALAEARSEPGAGSASVAVTVVSRAKLPVPDGAVVEAELLDATVRDAAPTIVARQALRTRGQPPYRLLLHYDPRAIDASGLYIVRARIVFNGLARFTSDADYSVITRGGAQDVTVVVRTAR